MLSQVNVIIMYLAFRIMTDGLPQVEISFADYLHDHMARLAMYNWTTLVGLDSHKEILLPGASSMQHVLSSHQAIIQGGVCFSASNTYGQATVACATPHAPLTAYTFEQRVTEYSGTALYVEVKFASPSRSRRCWGGILHLPMPKTVQMCPTLLDKSCTSL